MWWSACRYDTHPTTGVQAAGSLKNQLLASAEAGLARVSQAATAATGPYVTAQPTITTANTTTPIASMASRKSPAPSHGASWYIWYQFANSGINTFLPFNG